MSPTGLLPTREYSFPNQPIPELELLSVKNHLLAESTPRTMKGDGNHVRFPSPFYCVSGSRLNRLGTRLHYYLPSRITTSRMRGPCTPSTRISSISLVADGPEIMVTGRS